MLMNKKPPNIQYNTIQLINAKPINVAQPIWS